MITTVKLQIVRMTTTRMTHNPADKKIISDNNRIGNFTERISRRIDSEEYNLYNK